MNKFLAIVSLISLSCLLAPRLAFAEPGEEPLVIRFDPKTGAIEATGFSDKDFARLKSDRSFEDWSNVLGVRVLRISSETLAAPIVGKYEIVDKSLKYTPRYPFVPGIDYEARLDPRTLGRPSEAKQHYILGFSVKSDVSPQRTTVTEIFPSSSVVPENLLKLYLYFSGPMGRGEAYKHIRLLDGKGKVVERPFLELGEELWNPEMTRLTLLFDPGRIKRGLKPREEEGAILEAGKYYTFEVDAQWHDAAGKALLKEYKKSFRATVPDETQPDPKKWNIFALETGTKERLTVTFPESLDRAMLEHAIRVEVAGKIIAGRVEVGPDEVIWHFTPSHPWPEGDAFLLINPELEDLAGNSIARAFEVDNIKPEPAANSRTPVRIRIPRN